MAFGLPQISFIGYPLAVPCPGHAGLRFCATLTDAAVERHVAALWSRRALVLAARDGPLRPAA